MGTNYYAVGAEKCEECGRPYDDKEVHLGKSSAGWEFSFAWNEGKYYKNLKEFKEWLSTKTIRNEYGEEISHEEFWDMVKTKRGGLTMKKYYLKYPEHNVFNTKVSDHEIVVGKTRFIKGEFS